MPSFLRQNPLWSQQELHRGYRLQDYSSTWQKFASQFLENFCPNTHPITKCPICLTAELSKLSGGQISPSTDPRELSWGNTCTMPGTQQGFGANPTALLPLTTSCEDFPGSCPCRAPCQPPFLRYGAARGYRHMVHGRFLLPVTHIPPNLVALHWSLIMIYKMHTLEAAGILRTWKHTANWAYKSYTAPLHQIKQALPPDYFTANFETPSDQQQLLKCIWGSGIGFGTRLLCYPMEAYDILSKDRDKQTS